MIIVLWIVFSVIVGAIGSGKKIGFGGAFFLSLLLSPVIGLIVALVSESKEDIKERKVVVDQAKSNTENSVAEELKKLQVLLSDKVITQEEFESQKAKLLA